jgi:pSer/pThr/pTyr-binding forkhead associated (FHA) protein
MDCTLKATDGPENGQEFTCAGAETYIGRSQRCAVRLASPTVSFEHVVVHRSGDEFFVENLSANGTWLNNQRLTARTRLKARDQIRIGDQTVLRVERIPAAAGVASGSSRGLLILLLIVMVFGATAFLVLYDDSGPAAQDWQHAYSQLQTMIDGEVAAGRMQPNTATDFREAWRLEVAGARTDAGKAWLAVHVAVSDYEKRLGIQDISLQHRTALDRLLNRDARPLGPEEYQAALDQFVLRIQRHPKVK